MTDPTDSTAEDPSAAAHTFDLSDVEEIADVAHSLAQAVVDRDPAAQTIAKTLLSMRNPAEAVVEANEAVRAESAEGEGDPMNLHRMPDGSYIGTHWAARAMILSFKRSLGTAENFMRLSFTDPVDGKFAVLVQRMEPGKLTPEEKLAKVEKQLEAVRLELGETALRARRLCAQAVDEFAQGMASIDPDHSHSGLTHAADAVRDTDVSGAVRTAFERASAEEAWTKTK